jgi:hypothetical protein
MDASSAITLLSESFSRQLLWYEELTRIDRKALSQLVLSRGDMTPFLASMNQKRSIIEKIERERELIRNGADYYRENKETIPSSASKDGLERVLARSESAIKEFLDGENQMKRYLEFMMEKTATSGAHREGEGKP